MFDFNIPLQYGYTIGLVIPTFIWIYIYYFYPYERKEILLNSIILAIASPVTSYIWWTKDWWHPQTLTGTSVGFEDVWLGFACGVMGVLFDLVLKVKPIRIPKKRWKWQPSAHLVAISMPVIILILHNILGFKTFIATFIALFVCSVVMMVFRKDLIYDSIISGIIVFVYSIPMYLSIMLFVPDWIEKSYNWEHLSGYLFLGIPIEELLFWFFAGMFWGPLYKYWKHERFRKLNNL